MFSIRTPAWKLIREPGGDRLFDVRGDPGERTDVATGHPDVVDEQAARIDSWRASRRRIEPVVVVDSLGELERMRLETLGYVQ